MWIDKDLNINIFPRPWFWSAWSVMGGGRMMGKVFQCHKTDLDRSSRGVIAGIISKVDAKLSEKETHPASGASTHHLEVSSHPRSPRAPSPAACPRCPGACWTRTGRRPTPSWPAPTPSSWGPETPSSPGPRWGSLLGWTRSHGGNCSFVTTSSKLWRELLISVVQSWKDYWTFRYEKECSIIIDKTGRGTLIWFWHNSHPTLRYHFTKESPSPPAPELLTQTISRFWNPPQPLVNIDEQMEWSRIQKCSNIPSISEMEKQ